MIFLHFNYPVILATTLVYFILGWVWYTVAFQKPWMEGHGIPLSKTDAEKEKMKKGMPKTLAGAFLSCFILTIALEYFEALTHCHDWMRGTKEGLAAAAIAGVPIALNYMHTNKSLKLVLIDAGYHFVGLIVSGIILAVWA